MSPKVDGILKKLITRVAALLRNGDSWEIQLSGDGKGGIKMRVTTYEGP